MASLTAYFKLVRTNVKNKIYTAENVYQKLPSQRNY
jgi:hypothetical protein